MILFLLQIAAVHAVLLIERAAIAGKMNEVLRPFHTADHALPVVALLSAEALPGAVAVVIRRAAVLPVMRVIADQMRIHAVALENFGHGIVVGLDRAPAVVQEIVAAGMQLAARGHARKAARVAGFKLRRALREAGKVRRVRLGAAIRLEHMPVQGIVHHHYGAHCIHSFFDCRSAVRQRGSFCRKDSSGRESVCASRRRFHQVRLL